MNENTKDILTIYEFADEIRVHHNTVRNMIKAGRLSTFRLVGKKGSPYRIPRSEINRLAMTDLNIIVDRMVEDKIKGKNKE